MKPTNIGNSDLITQVNRRLVLQAVRSLQPTYRAEVSRRTRLKPATVTGIVDNLLSEELLQEVRGETKAPTPAGGRPPLMLELNGDARRVLAIDLEADVMRVAVVDLKMKLLRYEQEEIDRFAKPEPTVKKIVALSRRLIRECNGRKLDGIGLSLPGLIDKDQGILISSTNMPNWHNVPIRDMISEKLELVPQLERSSRLAAMYEDWVDGSEQRSTKLILSLRTGIGMSLIQKGEPYVGAGGFDGEIGHTVVDLNGEKCDCGGYGCLETFVSAGAVNRRAEEMIKRGRCKAVADAVREGRSLRPELIYQLAKSGDKDCCEIVRDVGHYVGIAAANLVNLLAPDTLVLCGSIDTADELLLEVVEQQIEERTLPQMRRHLTIRLASGREKSSLFGAAVLGIRDLFELPRLLHPQTSLT